MSSDDSAPDIDDQSDAEQSSDRNHGTSIENTLRQWLEDHHQTELEELNRRLPESSWIRLSVASLGEAVGSDLRDDVIHNPKVVENGTPQFKGLKKIISELVPSDIDSKLSVYWKDIPGSRLVGGYRSQNTERLVAIEGQIDQVTGVDPIVSVGAFECQRCKTTTVVEQTDRSDSLETPNECLGCERQGPFRLDRSESEMRDRQQLRLQTPPEHAQDGVENLTVSIIGDLAGEYTGELGRTAVVHGYLTTKETGEWERPFLLQAHDIKLVDGADVDVTAYQDEIDVYEEMEDPIPDIVDSRMLPEMYAPSGSDLRMLKLAVLLQACSLPRLPGGKRGDIHVFACGDPSTGKTDVASLAAEIVPRSEMVSTRVTGVGLTAAGVHDDLSGWTIKSGAIVRANKGMLVIDELDKINSKYIEDLHFPMESQRVSASVADQSVTLPAETSVLATANPKFGRWDQYEPIAEQLDVQSAMLSRFDLIITMMDNVETDRDKEVAAAVTSGYQSALEQEQIQAKSQDGNGDIGFLRAWVAAAQEYVPTIPDKQEKELEEIYVQLRDHGGGEDAPVPVTVRQLEGLNRLAAASARARHSAVVTRQDVERAKWIVKSCLKDVGIDPETGEFDADVVEVGRSKSQRDRIKNVTSTIKTLSRDSESGAPHEEVISELSDSGVDEEKAAKAIEDLLKKGEIYEPNEGFYRPC